MGNVTVLTHEEVIQTKQALKTYIDSLAEALEQVDDENQEACKNILHTCKSAYVKLDAIGRQYQQQYEVY